jgi:hypothetical protein
MWVAAHHCERPEQPQLPGQLRAQRPARGMNLDERLREFKLFESDDQKFWEEVTGGKKGRTWDDMSELMTL